MGSLKSKREKRLQRKLIPVNIVVCILALVAALSLFLAPIIKVDFGKVLRNEELIEVVAGDDLFKDSGDFAPVAKKLVSSVLSEAEGSITISAVSAFRVLTSDEKAEKVLDDLLFGDKALVTKLINSLVDGVADVFEDDDTKQIIEDAIVAALTNQILNNVEDRESAEHVMGNVKDLVEIFNKLDDEDTTPEAVAEEIVDKINELLGEDWEIKEDERQEFVNTIQELYDDTKKEVGEDGKVDLEAILCVAVSKNIDLGQLNLGELFDKLGGGESSVHINSVRDELEGEDSEGEDNEVEGGEGEDSGSGDVSYPTTYKELLARMGFDDSAKDSLKEQMRSSLNRFVKEKIESSGIEKFLSYYQYVFYGMLIFIVPWLILFLFSFFHLLAKNKRFMMWYVKLLGWIPPLIWLALKLFPVVAKRFFPSVLEGKAGTIINIALGGISTGMWISGLCYVLLWLVSIFWAFPIKRKIRKERKHPDGSDDDDYEEEPYESYYVSY